MKCNLYPENPKEILVAETTSTTKPKETEGSESSREEARASRSGLQRAEKGVRSKHGMRSRHDGGANERDNKTSIADAISLLSVQETEYREVEV